MARTKAEKEELKRQEAERIEKLRKDRRLKDEIWAIVLIGIGVFLFVSLFTQTTGVVGNAVDKVLSGLLGKWGANVLPFMLIVYGVLIFAELTSLLTVRSFIAVTVMYILYTCLLSVNIVVDKFIFVNVKEAFSSQLHGGAVGYLLSFLLKKTIGLTGLWIVCIVGIIICLMFVINTPISHFFDNLKVKREAAKALKAEEKQLSIDDIKVEKTPQVKVESSSELMKQSKEDLFKKAGGVEAKPEDKEFAAVEKLDLSSVKEFDTEVSGSAYDPIDETPIDTYSENQKQILSYVTDDSLFGKTSSDSSSLGLNGEKTKDVSNSHEISSVSITAEDVAKVLDDFPEAIKKARPTKVKYKFPPFDLLPKGTASKGGNASELNYMAKLLNDTLKSFGVDATVVDVVKGPAVTRFEVKPAPGVKVSSITRLNNDIALSLSAKSIRIEAPIPGMAAVGIEISNSDISTVFLRDVLESDDFKKAKSKISVGLGRSIDGKNVIMDIKKMPHLLIAGTTGSGKSVCINTILLSLLYKATPDEVKLILVDPKVVELSEFNGIPHMMIPVVTEPAKAAAALAWAVAEMNDRYNKFAAEGVKDLESYNDTVRANLEEEKLMPHIVIVIDELADLMISAKNQVEDQISRLCAKARAAGMHLIIATQSPRNEVLTGVIKANLPSKIALAVSTSLDSRIILDEGGAESLLGKGDMLYSPQDFPKPLRVQCCYVDEKEVHKVLDYVKANCEAPTYSDAVTAALDKNTQSTSSANPDADEDEYLMDCIEFAVMNESCSTSVLQRKFRIGYGRAARIMDIMEERGIIGPQDGSRGRKILITMEEFEQMKASNPDVEDEMF